MKNFQNKKFINTKISSIIFDCINKINYASNSISFYPANEMILQSIFIKLTGAQEQKFKSILWEWGCIDLEFRAHLLNYRKNNQFPEAKKYSAYNEKSELIRKLYNKIYKEVENKPDCVYDYSRNNLKEKLIENTKNTIKEIFIDSKSFYSRTRMFKDYWDDNYGFIKGSELELTVESNNFNNNTKRNKKNKKNKKNENDQASIGDEKELKIFSLEFQNKCYKKLYDYRNKCAHNLFVYQNQCLTLDELSQRDENDNIFKWIQTLLIIDELSIFLFEKLDSI